MYTDHLYGSFEFDTELTELPDGKGWKASALGYQAVHPTADQAVNDLNQLLNSKMESGQLVPNQG
jgi:hypothetical protein